VSEIRNWHREKGWRDIGYHYLIDRDGTVAPGRPLEQAGAHTRHHNADSIGIALVGGHGASKHDSFDEHFTAQQSHALRGLIYDLELEHGPMAVMGHNQFAHKGCPGFEVSVWLRSGR
jgi:N-acetyl-anhydromuramyl-L-alanine amidase AmpD